MDNAERPGALAGGRCPAAQDAVSVLFPYIFVLSIGGNDASQLVREYADRASAMREVE
jgi:hypothetical protein